MLKSQISGKLHSMTKDEIKAELAFYELCQQEMPSKQNAYEISVIKNFLSLFFQEGSIVDMLKTLRGTMNQHAQYFPQNEQEKTEEDELFQLLATLE